MTAAVPWSVCADDRFHRCDTGLAHKMSHDGADGYEAWQQLLLLLTLMMMMKMMGLVDKGAQ